MYENNLKDIEKELINIESNKNEYDEKIESLKMIKIFTLTAYQQLKTKLIIWKFHIAVERKRTGFIQGS